MEKEAPLALHFRKTITMKKKLPDLLLPADKKQTNCYTCLTEGSNHFARYTEKPGNQQRAAGYVIQGSHSSGKDVSSIGPEENLKKTLREISDYKYALDESSIVSITDEKGIIKHVNNNFCRISKYSREELIGQDHYITNSGYHPKEFMLNLWTNIGNGTIWRGELKNKAKDGTYYWVDTTIVPFLNEDGEPYQYMSVRTDITERKLVERKLEQANRELNRRAVELGVSNKELEQFAYVASHDLQEPLNTTSSFVGLLQKQYSGRFDDKADKYLAYILQASDRMKILIKDLLDYSRIGNKKEIKSVSCNSILIDVLSDLDSAINESQARIVYGALPVINGYATEIKQLFQEMIMNAIKFRKKGTAPQITISAKKSKEFWEFAFEDNGIGIDEKFNDKIFVIFRRLHTRNEYQGSGIGLSHCKKIVELHNGKIWFTSKPGMGSIFCFTLHDNHKTELIGHDNDFISIRPGTTHSNLSKPKIQ